MRTKFSLVFTKGHAGVCLCLNARKASHIFPNKTEISPFGFDSREKCVFFQLGLATCCSAEERFPPADVKLERCIHATVDSFFFR